MTLSSTDSSVPTSPPTATAADNFGQVEARGIDYIPAAERHGRPRELFWIWASANVTYLYVVVGGAMMLLGLTIWQALAVVVVGNLFWIAVGWLAVSGPAAGTASVSVMRAMFGINGNRIFGAGLGWIIAVGYEAVNLALGSLAAFALADQLGIPTPTWFRVVILVVIAVATFTISIYGHATIARLSPVFTAALVLASVVLGYFVFDKAQWNYTPADPLSGGELWSTIFIGLAIIGAAPLSWGCGADYSRYLPSTTSKSAVLWFTALGGLIPAVALGVIGVVAGTAIDMTDPQVALAAIVPAWFYPIFLAVIVVGSITNNVITTYSSGLSLQGIGIRAKRSTTVFIDGIIGGAIAIYAVFFADSFLDTLSHTLELSIIVLGPSIAVYAIDIVLRRNRYDGPSLCDESPTSKYWYHRGFQIPGIAAILAGGTAALLSASTTGWEGPVATALNGTDLSLLTGPVVAATVYAMLFKATKVEA